MPPMKVFTYCTDSHLHLLNEWLAKYLPSDLELFCAHGDQDCLSGRYLEDGWNATMIKKVRLIQRAIEETWGRSFLFVDADIQFFRSPVELLQGLLEEYDIVAQEDSPLWMSPGSILCAGLFACRSNPSTIAFWSRVHHQMQRSPQLDDQRVMNMVRRDGGIRFGVIPSNLFWSPRSRWSSGQAIYPPQEIIAHHANYCVGVADKQQQLSAVRRITSHRRGVTFHGSEYGGYFLWGENLCPSSVVYSVGIGEDATFDQSLIEKYRLIVHGFDPTPRSIRWVSQHLNSNEHFIFHPIGILDRNASVRHFLPINAEHVSCSTYRISNAGIDLPMRRLADVMRALGHTRLDLLKLDIEGAESVVLPDMLACGILPEQILFEVHPWLIGSTTVERLFVLLERYGYTCFVRHQNNLGFILK